MKPVVTAISSFAKDLVEYVPPGLFVFIATGFVNEARYIVQFRQELLGSLIMIVCTFSAGKWIGSTDLRLAWVSHFLGVIAADWTMGGPHVNPAVTMSMWTLGKCSYTEAYVRVAAQMGGGLVAFPLFHAVSNALEWTPFGGPEFNMDAEEGDHAVDAFLSEFGATFCLLFLIYLVNWEIHFGSYHYIIKQSLTACGIRALIELFPTAGPAMNPMLATAWSVFGVGTTYEFPSDMDHYIVYWISPGMAAVLASIVYAIYAGGTIFGYKLPIGPLKPSSSKSPETKAEKKKDE